MHQSVNMFPHHSAPHIAKNVPSPIINAISDASKKSGVDFSYLVQQAKAESSFNPNAKARTSSATGLYQFIDSTWMEMIDKYGDDYGLNTKGKSRLQILEMRKNPEAASFMAAAFASENEKVLEKHWGGDIGATELYFAHFMGASGASAFLNARDENPMTPAADLFPRAARANYNVFYDKDTGKARSLEEVYAFFDKKFNIEERPSLSPSSENIQMSNIPNPPELPSRKKFQTDGAYVPRDSIHKTNVIMQRAQAMRDDAQNSLYHVQNHDQIDRLSYMKNHYTNERSSFFTKTIATHEQKSPFLSLIAKPLDVMILTQNAPRRVIPSGV